MTLSPLKAHPRSLRLFRLGRFLLLLMPLMLSSCLNTAAPLKLTTAQIVVFGTFVDISVYTKEPEQAQRAINALEQRFQNFHHAWHAWEQGGIVSKINRAIQAETPITVAQSIKDFILKSQTLSAQSDYLFDPGLGKLIALWGFHSENWSGPPPSETQINHWLKTRPSIADIQFNGLTLSSRNPNVQLDFGGNAKGLALDIAMHQLKTAGIENAIVNIGGDLRVIGSKNHQAWRIGIQNPNTVNGKSTTNQSAQPIAMVELIGDESLVTSGTYQRFFEWQGQTFSHILDPNTGRPAQSFASVSVLHKDATTADTAATALLIAGPDRWQAVAKKMGIEHVFIIDRAGQILQTPPMAERTKILAQN